MSAVPINLIIEAGADWTTSFNLRDDSGDYLPLSGYLVNANMARNYRKTGTKTSLNGTVSNAATGEITVSLNASETSALIFGRYVYDIVITAPINVGGKKEKVIEGIITVQEGVSTI